jgi:hypothetical protein
MTDVVLEIEARIIHPVRAIETAGQLGQPPAKDVGEMQPRVELFENPLEGHLAARGGRRVIDQQHLDLQWGLWRFGAQHHVVGPTQLLHGRPFIHADLPTLGFSPRPENVFDGPHSCPTRYADAAALLVC